MSVVRQKLVSWRASTSCWSTSKRSQRTKQSSSLFSPSSRRIQTWSCKERAYQSMVMYVNNYFKLTNKYVHNKGHLQHVSCTHTVLNLVYLAYIQVWKTLYQPSDTVCVICKNDLGRPTHLPGSRGDSWLLCSEVLLQVEILLKQCKNPSCKARHTFQDWETGECWFTIILICLHITHYTPRCNLKDPRTIYI